MPARPGFFNHSGTLALPHPGAKPAPRTAWRQVKTDRPSPEPTLPDHPPPRLFNHGSEELCLHLSASHLAAHGPGHPPSLKLWPLEGRDEDGIPYPGVAGAAFSPDGSWLHLAGYAGLVGHVDLQRGRVTPLVLPGPYPLEDAHRECGEPAAVDPGRVVVPVTSQDGSGLLELNLEGGEPRWVALSPGHWLRLEQVHYTPDGQAVLAVCVQSGEVQELFHWDLAGGPSTGLHVDCTRLAVFPDGTGLVTLNGAGQLQPLRLEQGERGQELRPAGPALRGLEWGPLWPSSGGRFLLQLGKDRDQADYQLLLWDQAQGVTPAQLPVPGIPRDAAVGGNLAATLSETPEGMHLALWSLTSGRLLAHLPPDQLPQVPGFVPARGSRSPGMPSHLAHQGRLRFSPDGRWLAAAAEPWVAVWEVASLLA